MCAGQAKYLLLVTLLLGQYVQEIHDQSEEPVPSSQTRRRRSRLISRCSLCIHGISHSISKSAIPPAIPNQSQDTAHSRVNMANQAPVMLRIEEFSTSLLPSQKSALVKAGGVALKGLETVLRLLERSAGAFPPLKLAVGGLVACLDLTQVNYLFGFDFLDVVFEVDFRQLSRTVKSMRT
jgi:hypothetical protein